MNKLSWDLDLGKLNWKNYTMNFGYGIKHFILKEEAALPSMGYNDVVQRMNQQNTMVGWLPYVKTGRPIRGRNHPDMIKMILNKESVKEEMASLVSKRLEYYRGTMHLDTTEDQVYREVEKSANDSLNTIISDYSHKALSMFASVMKFILTTIYEKIVVNEGALKKVKELCANRKGPIIFCPTHRSYVDFLLVSSVLFFY